MSRLASLRRHPKRTLSGLAAVLLAVGVAIGSGADFSASSNNNGNSVTAGTLSITNGTVGSILNVSNLKPGGSSTSTVDIQNAGNISAAFSLYRGAITDTPSSPALSGKLKLIVTDCGLWTTGGSPTAPDCSAATVGNAYGGSTGAALSGLGDSTTPTSLSTFAGGAKHRYQFIVSLDSGADNTYQGGNSTVDLTWSAVQS